MPDGLYHLATAAEWTKYQREGFIAPPSLAIEGFVHCSWGRQVSGTIEKHFMGVRGLLALRIEASRSGVELLVEDSYASGEAFPHAYGAIRLDAVVEVLHLDGEV